MLLSAKKLTKIFHPGGLFNQRKSSTRAIDCISFDIQPQEILGVIGESGSGKTTLARMIAGITEPTEGRISLSNEINDPHTDIQMIFQNPFEALDPRMSVRASLEEPLRVKRQTNSLDKVIDQVCRQTEIPRSWLSRKPSQFSGGQRQRIVIARSIVTNPKLLVCDEPTASLDSLTQRRILGLLLTLKKEMYLSILFISHDLDLVSAISDRMIVLTSGIIVEIGATKDVMDQPLHPYTRMLVQSNPQELFQNKKEKPIHGPGCAYVFDCSCGSGLCRQKTPDLRQIRTGHFVACHHAN